ncbi:MAG: hypothetical protein H0W72_13925 [Planctomycetes bacterium]|nr:hypothetical protein [Planctomycetota bacterium]
MLRAMARLTIDDSLVPRSYLLSGATPGNRRGSQAAAVFMGGIVLAIGLYGLSFVAPYLLPDPQTEPGWLLWAIKQTVFGSIGLVALVAALFGSLLIALPVLERLPMSRSRVLVDAAGITAVSSAFGIERVSFWRFEDLHGLHLANDDELGWSIRLKTPSGHFRDRDAKLLGNLSRADAERVWQMLQDDVIRAAGERVAQGLPEIPVLTGMPAVEIPSAGS